MGSLLQGCIGTSGCARVAPKRVALVPCFVTIVKHLGYPFAGYCRISVDKRFISTGQHKLDGSAEAPEFISAGSCL